MPFPDLLCCNGCTQHLVKLDPVAVELIDRTMIELARNIPIFKSTIDSFVKGEPDAVLLVEFSGDDLGSLKGSCRN